MVVEYFITTNTLTTKNYEGINKKFKIFFAKFQAPFSQKIINIEVYS